MTRTMSLKDLFASAHARINPSPKIYYAVIDTSNDTLATIGTHVQSVAFIAETMMEGFFVPAIGGSEEVVSIARSDPRTFPEWTWLYGERTFKKTNPSVVTNELRDRAVLLAKKRDAVAKVNSSIFFMRSKIHRGIPLQERVYMDKENEARMLQESNFDESLVTKAPYVAQYAELYEIPLKQAAETILLKAQLDRDLLVKTERTRLSLLKKIREATTAQEIDATLASFRATGAVL
jgi:hypothetical protein